MIKKQFAMLGGVAVLAAAVVLAAAAVSTGSPGPSEEIAALKQQVAQLRLEAKIHKTLASQLAVLNVQSRIAFIDGSGFHGLATSLKAGTIGSRDLGTVQKALEVTSKIGWPAGLEEKAGVLKASLQKLVTALEAKDVAAAAEAAEAVHDAQHELSNAAYAWLS